MSTQADRKTPAQRLLDAVGPMGEMHEDDGNVGLIGGATTEEVLDGPADSGPLTHVGPLQKIHAFWFPGMSCDGCTVSVLGAQAPTIESMLLGAHPGLPRVMLHHAELAYEAGTHYVRLLEQAAKGELDAPYVLIFEGSVTDETTALQTGGYWAGHGEEPWGPGGTKRSVTSEEWAGRLAPGAAAAIAIGTCATWGGIPASENNPTGSMSLMDFLGRDYRSAAGLPVINVPGCAPIGDNFTETVAAILYFMQGLGPFPEFDELGRPAWLFGETVHRHCVRGSYYEEGDFAKEFGDKECLVEIGCWGPVVNCNITSRGAINHVGGCMNAGGACIGCTMPGFADKFTPFYKVAPGSAVSSTLSRFVGGIIRPLRMYSNEHLNREPRWDLHGTTPSGWARHKPEPGALREAGHQLYDWRRRSTDTAKHIGKVWGRRTEWTERQDPDVEQHLPGGTEDGRTA